MKRVAKNKEINGEKRINGTKNYSLCRTKIEKETREAFG